MKVITLIVNFKDIFNKNVFCFNVLGRILLSLLYFIRVAFHVASMILVGVVFL